MANKQIRYGIGFDVDKTGLQELRAELNSLNNITEKDLKIVDSASAKQELAKVKADINALGDAIEQAYNPKLGTVNVDTFNKSLRDSNTSIKQVEASFSQLGPRGSAAFRNMTAEIFTTQKAVKQTSGFIDSMAKTLFNTLKWSVASSAINTVASSIRNAWNYTKSLDTSLNDIRIVTEKSAEEMDKFAVRANKAAKALGAQTTAYTKASLIYYQQGLAEEDVQARTNVTMKAANVTGQSAAEVSEQLTAVWNGYRVVAEEAELYVDKLSAVAASTAADLEELSEGMSKVASGANAMGVDIDQLTAQLSTIISVTRQDASSVGTALKTIFARMGDLKVDGVDEFGVSLGEVSGTLQKVGVEVLDLQGNLRPMGEVMEEVAGKWGHWTEAQQQAVAVAMAGKRQYNNLLALFENWDMYESALTTSKTSEGTLQKQQDIYMESLEAKLQQLSTSGERIYKSIFDSDSMKDFIDVLTVGLDGVGSFIDGIGGGGNLLLGIVSILGHRFSNEIAKGIGMAAHNMGVLRENALQARAESELMEKYSDASEEAIQKMTALKTEQLKAEKLLTEEEREQYDYLIKQTAELYNQKDALKQEKVDTDTFFQNEFGNENIDTSNLSDEEKIKQINNVLGLYDSNKTVNQSNKIKNAIKTEDILDAAEATSAEFTAISSSDRSDLFTSDQYDLIKQKQDELEISTRKLIIAQDELDKAIQDGKDVKEKEIKVLEAQNDVKQKSQVLNSSIQKGLKSSEAEYEKHKKVLEENAKAQERNNRAIEDNEKISKSLTKSVNFKAITQGATEFVSSAGMFASSIMSISNAFKVLGDETLSSGEKILQFISGFGMAIPMLIGSLKGMAGGIEAVATATTLQNTTWWSNVTAIQAATAFTKAKNETDQKAALIQLLLAKTTGMTNDELKDKSLTDLMAIATEKGLIQTNEKGTISFLKLGASIWGTVWPVLLVMGAIALLIGTITLLVNHFKDIEDNGKAAFEKASKAAQKATERFNETKQAYEDLKKSIEDYDKAQKAIDEMTKGTDEWREAIQEANAQVIDLIDKYPELAKYISNVDSRLVISEEGKEAILKSQSAEVGFANRGKIVANIEKNKAESNMIRQEGANKIFDIDAMEKGGKGIVDGVVYDAGGPAYYQNAYDQALKAIEKHGNAILGNKETFIKALEDANINIKDDELIDALWKNKEELEKNSAAIIANNEANKIQQQQAAASYLQDKSEMYQESKNQSAISKIIAQNAGTDSQAYKDELSALGGDDGISTKEAENVFNKSGIKGTFKKAEDGVITYLDENNEEKQIGADALAQQVAQEKALAKTGEEGSIQKIEETLNKVSNNFGNKFGNAASKAVTSFVAGETGDLSSLTEKELQKISKNPNNYKITDEQAKTLGYENAEAYAKAFEKAIANYNYELNNITTGLNTHVKAAFNSLDTSDWSLPTQKAVSKSLEAAFKNSGPDAVIALKDLYAKIGSSLDEEDMQALTNVAGKIDWSSSSALLDFKNQLTDLGIEIDNKVLDTFANKMSNLVNPIGEVLNNLKGLVEKFKEFGDLTKDLKLGQVFSEEDYKNLIKYNRELAKYFILTADGYVYTGGANDLIKDTKASQLNITEVKDQFANAKTQGQKINSMNIFDKYANTDDEKYMAINKLFSGGLNGKAYEDLFLATGYNIDQINDALKANYNGTIIKNKKYNLSDLAGMKAEDLKEELGLNTIEEAQSYITDAQVRLDESKKIVSDVYEGINTYLTQIEEGTFDQNLEETLSSYIRFVADDYKEFKTYKNQLPAELYDKLAKVYLAEEAQELGIDAEAWEKIANSLSVNKQEEYINLTKEGQDLKDIQEELFGAKLLDNLDAQIEKRRKLLALEQDENVILESTKELIDLMIESFSTSLQIKLDLSEAKRQLNEFNAKYSNRSGINLLEELTGLDSYNLANKQFNTYQTDLDTHLRTFATLGSFDAKGNFSPFVNGAKDSAAFWDIFNEAYDGAKESFEEMFTVSQEMSEAYISIQEEIVAIYDEQAERISNINNLYASSVDMLSLLNDNTGKYTDEINKFLEATTTNAKTAHMIAMDQLNAAQTAYENDYANATKEQKELLEENLNSAAEKVLETSKTLVEAISKQFTESLTKTIESAFGNVKLSQISEEWERDLYFDERYLDETNKAYGLSDLERKFQKSIDETDSYSAQKKLNELKQKELDLLSKKDKLTQADFDRANARYELELKKIALEEAQQTANKMKLVRDASGNYTYQYVQDQDEIAKAEEEFAKAENDLYNLQKDQEKDLVSTLISKYQEAISSIGGAQTAEEKNALNEFYFGSDGVISLLEKDLELLGNNTGEYTNSYKNTINKLLTADPTQMNTDIGTLINTFSDSVTDLDNSLTEMFDSTMGKEGSLTKAINTLSNNIAVPDYANTITPMLGGATNILKELTGPRVDNNGNPLPSILETISNYAKNLASYGEVKLDNLGDATSQKANTEALNNLTAAIITQTDMLDGKLDAKNDGNDIKVANWKFENGNWILDQNGGVSNP